MPLQAVQKGLADVAPPSVLYDAQLLVSERDEDCWSQAHLASEDSIRLTIEPDSDSGVIRVEVSDPGPGFVHEPSAATLSAGGGRGLYLMQQIARRWGVSRNRVSVVWFELPLDRARKDRAPGASARAA